MTSILGRGDRAESSVWLPLSAQSLHLTSLAVGLLLAVAPLASAQAFSLTLGGAVGFAPVHEGASELTVTAAPIIRPSFGPVADSPAGRVADEWGRRFQVGPSFAVIAARNDSSPNAAVALLDPVDTALELGAYVGTGWTLPEDQGALALRLAARHDVLGGHGGFQIEPSVTYARAFDDRWAGSLSVASAYASEKYVDSYFDISTGESLASGLSAYDASAGFKDVSVSAGLSFDLTPRWTLAVDNRYQRLLGSVADSPVVADVGSANQFSSSLSLRWRWQR